MKRNRNKQRKTKSPTHSNQCHTVCWCGDCTANSVATSSCRWEASSGKISMETRNIQQNRQTLDRPMTIWTLLYNNGLDNGFSGSGFLLPPTGSRVRLSLL